MAREQEGQEARNKAKREMFDELMKLHAKAAEKSLSSLLKTEIQITDAKIQVKTVRNVDYNILEPAIMVQNNLTSKSDEDVAGNMVFILRQRDMQVFLHQLMGIEELPEPDFEFDDTALSAVEEVMNQMVSDSVASMAAYLEDDMSSSACNLILSEGPDTFGEVIGEEPGASTFVIRYRIRIKDVLDSEFMECISATAIASINQEITYKQEADEEPEEEELEEEEPEEEVDEEEEYLDDDLDDSDVGEYLDEDIDYVGGYEDLEPPKKSVRKTQPARQPVKPPVKQTVKQTAKKPVPPKKTQPAVQKQAAAPSGKKKVELWHSQTIHENLGLIMDVPLKVSVEIGRTKRRLKDVLNFGNGMVVELDKQADAPVDIIVNGQLIARGEVVVIDDNFGVRISEIVNTRSIIGNGE